MRCPTCGETDCPDVALAERAQAYIRKIRNPVKRSYAGLYWSRLMAGDPEDGGELDHYGLSEMGAQAVRMRLDAICNPVQPNAAAEYMRHNTPPVPKDQE